MSLQVIAASATNFALFEEDEAFEQPVMGASFLVQHMDE
jgi:hypothetical protein